MGIARLVAGGVVRIATVSLLAMIAFTPPPQALAQSDVESSNPPAKPSNQDIGAQIRALHWVRGPASVQALQNAAFQIPEHYVFLDSGDTAKFMNLTQNPTGGELNQIFAPDDLHWWAFLSFAADGYVADQEKLDGAAILASIKQGTEQANIERRKNGWPEMTVVGWRRPPSYDGATKRLEWSLDGKDSEGTLATNFDTKILGRRGVTSVTLVTSPDHVEQDIAQFKSVLTGYQFNAGDRYSEFKQGDKVATYGLAALIVGGAAAVAAKTGIFKALAKFLWIGVAALAVGVRKLFRRRKS